MKKKSLVGYMDKEEDFERILHWTKDAYAISKKEVESTDKKVKITIEEI